MTRWQKIVYVGLAYSPIPPLLVGIVLSSTGHPKSGAVVSVAASLWALRGMTDFALFYRITKGLNRRADLLGLRVQELASQHLIGPGVIATQYRCLSCDETFGVELQPYVEMEDTGQLVPLGDVPDIVVPDVACPRCGATMLRLDPRLDWIPPVDGFDS